MYQGLPDWMFAAFAIGGWELFDTIARHWNVPKLRWVGAAIVGICLMVLAIRYLLRYLRRRRKPDDEDVNDWRNY